MGTPMSVASEKQLGAANDGVGHAAAGFADGSGQLGEEIPIDGRAAVVDEIAENEEEDGDGDERADAGHRQHEAADEFAPAETGVHDVPRSAAALRSGDDQDAGEAVEDEGEQERARGRVR